MRVLFLFFGCVLGCAGFGHTSSVGFFGMFRLGVPRGWFLAG
jgi:TRAP-type C4-dicarboxylate transport system permease small subunit